MTTKSNTPVVWVVQEGRNDYSAAEQFGEVRFITDKDIRNIPNSTQNKEVAHDIRKFLSAYLYPTDFIIPAGNPMVVAMVTLSLSQGLSHNFLKWDGRRAVYVPYTLSSVK